MNSIEDFLRNIEPYTYDDLREFITELERVPGYEEKFLRLLRDNPKWLEAALSTKTEEGYHVYYLLDYVKPSTLFDVTERENEISLRNFSMGTAPTIKVSTYPKKKELLLSKKQVRGNNLP